MNLSLWWQRIKQAWRRQRTPYHYGTAMINPGMKPYLVRAIYQWCIDHQQTPQIAVQVNDQCRVPTAYVRDGMIVFNIGPTATKDLYIEDDFISFQARFNGVAQLVSVPMGAVMAAYSRDTQEGMGFEVDHSTAQNDTPTKNDHPPTGNGGGRFRIVE